MYRASALSLASLWTLLGTAACQEQLGKCSSDTSTLCLQIELADSRVIPDHVALTAATATQRRTFDFPNLAAQLAARPYVVEVAFDSQVPTTLDLDAVGSVTDSVTRSQRTVAVAKLPMLNLATAVRPTKMVLQLLGDNDLGLPTGDLSGGTPGDGGTLPDMPPAAWTMVHASPGTALNALFGIGGTTKIYAAGNNGVVISGDGNTFAPTAAKAGTGTLSGIWVASSSSAFACDKSGTAFRTADGGATWISASAGYSLSAIYGRSATDVLAVGNSVTSAFQLNGSNWQQTAHNLGAAFTGVFASATNYYALGNSGIGGRAATLPTVWTSLTGGANTTPWAISGLGTSDTFTVAVSGTGTAQYLSGTGTTWTSMAFPASTPLRAVWVPATMTAIVGGDSGTVYQYTSGTWTTLGSVASGYSITGLWGDSSGGLWATAVNGNDGAIFNRK